MSAVLSEEMMLELGLESCVVYLTENSGGKKGMQGATEVNILERLG